jgi:Domain of unknown function (DUF3846)
MSAVETSATEQVRVLCLQPDGRRQRRQVADTLATWQALVGGLIEFVVLARYLNGDQLVAIINDEGLFTLPPTPWVWPTGSDAEVVARIHGPVVVARWRFEPNGDDHAVSLTDGDRLVADALFPRSDP